MRRTPAPTALSPSDVDETDIAGRAHMRAAAELDRIGPARLRRRPRSSPIETTRTSSPYFSPNSAIAPSAIASSTAISRVSTGVFWRTIALASCSTVGEFGGVERLGMREVEAQALRRDHRSLLRDMGAEHLAQASCRRCVAEWFGADPACAARDRPRAPAPRRPSTTPSSTRRRDGRRGRPPSSACSVTREPDALAAHRAGVAELAAGLARRTASG